jgi:hypothetical protein
VALVLHPPDFAFRTPSLIWLDFDLCHTIRRIQVLLFFSHPDDQTCVKVLHNNKIKINTIRTTSKTLQSWAPRQLQYRTANFFTPSTLLGYYRKSCPLNSAKKWIWISFRLHHPS